MKKNESIRSLLNQHRTVAVVGGQFGDEGKGKFGDAFAEWADIIVRGTGGANAGHTISIDGEEHIFHLVPSGILHDKDGKTNIIGRGTAFDPGVVCRELELLRSKGVSYNHLRLSQDAHLVLPQHLVMDRVLEQCEGKIGTTGRGIGPVYMDHIARTGLRLNDLLNPGEFARKLKINLRDKCRFLQTVEPDTLWQVFEHDHLQNGRFWSEKHIFNEVAIMETYLDYAVKLQDMICDTDRIVQTALGEKNILLEGAQANLLSIDYGTYPFVTSSDCTLRGLAKGVGLPERSIGLTLNVVKAFYMTRVGEGPFPTEFGGSESAEWCSTKGVNRKLEYERFGDLGVNHPGSEWRKGIAIRIAGKEYGSTTGRPRRTGWLDLPLLRYSLGLSGPDVILTKLDVLDECDEIKICTEYEYTGPGYRLGQLSIQKGDRFIEALPYRHFLENCAPIYRSFPGWKEPIGGMRKYGDLPAKLLHIIHTVKKETPCFVRVLSVGPDRDQTIVVK